MPDLTGVDALIFGLGAVAGALLKKYLEKFGAWLKNLLATKDNPES